MDRGLLRWTYVLIAVDLATWLMAWMWLDLSYVVSALAAWAALSLGAVSVLYIAAAYGHHTGPWLKGERAPWLQPVFFPFRAISVLIYVLARRSRTENVVCEVAPRVFLGPRLFDSERSALETVRVTAVMDLTSELPTSRVYSHSPFERLGYCLLDRSFPNDCDLDELVASVVSRATRDQGVFIHCAFGRGRSALVACAVVIALGVCTTAEESLAHVKRCRPAVRIRKDGVEILRRFAARHAKNDSVTPVDSFSRTVSR
jgi:hypothetical protein